MSQVTFIPAISWFSFSGYFISRSQPSSYTKSNPPSGLSLSGVLVGATVNDMRIKLRISLPRLAGNAKVRMSFLVGQYQHFGETISTLGQYQLFGKISVADLIKYALDAVCGFQQEFGHRLCPILARNIASIRDQHNIASYCHQHRQGGSPVTTQLIANRIQQYSWILNNDMMFSMVWHCSAYYHASWTNTLIIYTYTQQLW